MLDFIEFNLFFELVSIDLTYYVDDHLKFILLYH